MVVDRARQVDDAVGNDVVATLRDGVGVSSLPASHRIRVPVPGAQDRAIWHGVIQKDVLPSVRDNRRAVPDQPRFALLQKGDATQGLVGHIEQDQRQA